jgi:hypothetical protein
MNYSYAIFRVGLFHKTVTRQSLLIQELRFLDLEWDK